MRLLPGLVAYLWFAAAAMAGEFSDSAHRMVRTPDLVRRVIPAGPPADALIYALAPDMLAGLVEPWNDAQRASVPLPLRAIHGVPRLTGSPGVGDLDAIAALGADLIVDYGDVNERFAALADRGQTKLGIPWLLFDGSLEQAPDVVRRLGHLLGRDERAGRIARAMENGLATLRQASNQLDAIRPAIYYARGIDGLQAIRDGSSLGMAITLAGGRNVVEAGRGALKAMTVDEVVRLHPDFVVVADAQAVAPDSPLRRAFTPATRFLVDTSEPYGAIERPPSINRLIGALLLAAVLHPDLAAAAREQAQALAKLLYGDAASATLVE